ncbi:MAG: hypothetical protein AABX82_04235 [Nanoarchaeota archaeon]
MAKKHRKPLHTTLQKQLDTLVIDIVQAYAANKGPRLSYTPKAALIISSPLLPLRGEVPYFIRQAIGEDPFWRHNMIQPQVDAHLRLFARYELSLSAEAQASLAAIFDQDVCLNVKDTVDYMNRQGVGNAQIYAVSNSAKEERTLTHYPRENIARLVWQMIEEEKGILDLSSPLAFVTPLLAQYALTRTLPEGDSTKERLGNFLDAFGAIPRNFVYNQLLDPERRRDLAAHLQSNEELSQGFKALERLFVTQPYPAMLIVLTEFSLFRLDPTERNFFASLREYAGSDVARDVQRQNYRSLYKAFETAVIDSRMHH